MLIRLASALLISAHLAAAALPEADKLVEELSAAHAKLPGYVATWHAEGEGKSLDLTIAEDRKTGSFALQLQATGPHGKIDLRQWSPDGNLVFIDSNGTRAKMDCASAELAFMQGFGEVFLDRKTFDAIKFAYTPVALLDSLSIKVQLGTGMADKPGWAMIAGNLKTADVTEDRTTFTSDDFGRLTIDRANGVLLRQEIGGEKGEKRVLERRTCRTEGAADEITRLTRDWTTLGATDVGMDLPALKSRMEFLQFIIDGIEAGQGSLEKLEEKLSRKDELLEYGRRALIKSKEPAGGTLAWDKVLDLTRAEARKRWTAGLPEGEADDDAAFAKYLAAPENRTGIRDVMADGLTAAEGIVPGVVFALFGPRMNDGLVAKSATGRVAKAAIETALCRAYLAAMLEEKMAAAWGERENFD